jgi:hypothetical protein
MQDAQAVLHSLPERELLARCIWGEARGEPVEGKLAVAHVVMNRKDADTYYGHSIADVILRRWQFSCFNETDPNLSQIIHLTDKNLELTYCRAIADAVVFERTSGRNADPTGGATHYHTASTKPSWADSPQMKHLCRIGNHLFYREILKRSAEEHGENARDESLMDMLDEMNGQGGGTTATDVPVVAQACQDITNTVSAASQAVSTAKQDDQKITQNR